MALEVPRIPARQPLNDADREELERLCAMLDFVALNLADRFGDAPAQVVANAQANVLAHFQSD